MHKNQKSAKQRSLEFFQKSAVLDFHDLESVKLSCDYDALEKFWEKWLETNSIAPSDHVYHVVYAIIRNCPNSDIFSEFIKYKSTKKSGLATQQFLYGVEIGKIRYDRMVQSRQKANSKTSSKKIETFLKNPTVVGILQDTLITDDVVKELIALFDTISARKLRDCYELLADFILYFSPNFVERFAKIKEVSTSSDEYFRLRYVDKADEMKVAKFEKASNAAKKVFKSSISYWLDRGYSLDDARKAVTEHQKQTTNMREDHHINARTVEFWMRRGMTESEAVARISILQRRDIEFFIEKYGEVDGRIRYESMMADRKSTFNGRSIEEKDAINKSKGKSFDEMVEKHGLDATLDIIAKRTDASNRKSISTESIEFFKSLDELLGEMGSKSITGYKGKEWFVRTKSGIYFLDYIIGNCVIEYHGSFWHADKRFFGSEDIHPIRKKTASEIWNNDAKRLENLIAMGYSVLNVWSRDVVIDRNEVLLLCKEFINDKYDVSNSNQTLV